ILFLTILFVQFQSTQYLAIIMLFTLLGWTALKNLSTLKAVKKKELLSFYLWTLMIVLMIRPQYINLNETKIEVICLFLGCVSLLIVSLGGSIQRIPVIKIMVNSGVIGAVLNLIFHLTSLYPLFLSGTINYPYAGTRWVGGFTGPNEFGAFYVMILALVLGLYLEKEYSIFQMFIRASMIVPLV